MRAEKNLLEDETPRPDSAGRGSSRWLRNGSILVGGIIVLTYVVIIAVSLVWTPMDPNAIDPMNRLAPAGSPGHLLGTDSLGRDVLSALLSGAKNSAAVAAGACGLSVVLGTVLGLVAASTGRIVDELIMRAMDVCVSIPGVVIALVLAATVGSGIGSTIFALLFFFTPAFTRMVRANALRVLSEDFPKAAELYGRGTAFIAVRHVLPNIFSILLVQASQYYAVGILTEAGLSYLGVGVNRPEVSWGMMLKEAQWTVGIDSPLAMWPGIAIMVTVLGLNVLGDGIRDVLDPKLQKAE
ncbi:ABC transporter permease [Actinomyces mediterranea]|uniref:ABC transporter permease n=1 Tax=Actinomyces mediterranea TaxID=1871028 RepID=UPI0009F9F28E|nr:ABC transporter permease [Actinomyces mediterranea]